MPITSHIRRLENPWDMVAQRAEREQARQAAIDAPPSQSTDGLGNPIAIVSRFDVPPTAPKAITPLEFDPQATLALLEEIKAAELELAESITAMQAAIERNRAALDIVRQKRAEFTAFSAQLRV